MEPVKKSKPAKVKPPHNSSKNTRITKIKELAITHPNATKPQIAAMAGISKQALYGLLKRHEAVLPSLPQYKEKRADIYAALESEILASVNSECVEKASLLQRVTAAGILKTHERLERGHQTPTVSILFNIIRDAAGGQATIDITPVQEGTK